MIPQYTREQLSLKFGHKISQFTVGKFIVLHDSAHHTINDGFFHESDTLEQAQLHSIWDSESNSRPIYEVISGGRSAHPLRYDNWFSIQENIARFGFTSTVNNNDSSHRDIFNGDSLLFSGTPKDAVSFLKQIVIERD